MSTYHIIHYLKLKVLVSMVSLFSFLSGLSWGVRSLSPQQPVSVVLLRPSSETSSLLSRSPVLVAGCEDGSVHCVKWESPTVSYHRRLNRSA